MFFSSNGFPTRVMKQQTDIGAALARIARAERDVQLAAAALQQGFRRLPGSRPPSFQLAQFSAALHELKKARDALYALTQPLRIGPPH